MKKKSKSGYIIFKLQKIKDKEFFKEVREEKVTYREAAQIKITLRILFRNCNQEEGIEIF